LRRFKPDTDPTGGVGVDKANAGVLEGLLNPDLGRDVSRNQPIKGFNSPNRRNPDLGSIS
jgi:hypothetical protein